MEGFALGVGDPGKLRKLFFDAFSSGGIRRNRFADRAESLELSLRHLRCVGLILHEAIERLNHPLGPFILGGHMLLDTVHQFDHPGVLFGELLHGTMEIADDDPFQY